MIDGNIDRRAFVAGRWNEPGTASSGEIASALVQARPERLHAVEAAIAALAGCEVHARDPKGKLVVVIDAPDSGAIGATLNTIALMPDVLSAALVFHAVEAV